MDIDIIKSSYPNLSEEDIRFITNKVSNKCNYYYFLDFIKTTGGNVQDAYEMFKFDEQLRSILFKYLIRFEIQIKSDFVEYVSNETHSDHFWSDRSSYIFTRDEDFMALKEKIRESFKNLNISSKTENAYAAVYVMSFGTFITMFKKINPNYKRSFIKKYTRYLPVHSYDILYKYLLCLRALRNRCAHGTHIVSRSFLNQLYQHNAITKTDYIYKTMTGLSVFELTIRYLMKTLTCGPEASKEIKRLLVKYENVYKKYGGKQTINPSIVQKLFN